MIYQPNHTVKIKTDTVRVEISEADGLCLPNKPDIAAFPVSVREHNPLRINHIPSRSVT